MSLAAITRSRDFFKSCLSRVEVAPQHLNLGIENVKVVFKVINDKQRLEAMLSPLVKRFPKLWICAPSTSSDMVPLIHVVARSRYSKSVMEVCVQVGGKAILEVGDSLGETPIFRADSYQLLKRLTDLGAEVNVVTTIELGQQQLQDFNTSASLSVLEHCVTFNLTSSSGKRCIKHLIRLGACIQENSRISQEARTRLESVYQEFSEEIATMVGKIETLTLQFGIPEVVAFLIYDYALGEEDSETREYDDYGRYILDDETEAYAFFKRCRAQRQTASVIELASRFISAS